MKKMRDLAINPRKGRKKGKAVRIDLMPMVTALPFFTFFLIANFCLFCQKGKSCQYHEKSESTMVP
jgi:hypothetical protein